MSPTLLEQGVEIMLFGMGTVIAFLTLLVITMVLMSRLLETFYPAATQATQPASVPTPSGEQLESGDLLAVIMAAVHRHRQQSGKMHQKETSHG